MSEQREGGGEFVPTLAGTVVQLPYAGEHECFQNRQAEPCGNKADWRMETAQLCLHWCSYCSSIAAEKFPEAQWIRLRARPS